MNKKIYSGVVVLGLLLGAVCQADPPSDWTPLGLVKEGNKYVGIQAQDKVVQIRSDKSVGSLKPEVWYIVYYDPTATMKQAEVKFGGGQMMSVKRPVHLLHIFEGGAVQMKMNKIKVDSGRAFEIARHEPLLQNLDLRATQFTLERVDAEPTWKVRFWASKLNHPDQMADIGQIFVSAYSGQVVKNDLHINSVD